MVVQVHSVADLNQHLRAADANRLLILDFYADWCGPCKYIAPLFSQLANQYKNATFIKVNVDQARDVSAMYGVRAMPTFVFVKQGKEVDRVQGANPQALEQTIQRHYNSTPANPNAASDTEREFLSQFVACSEKVTQYNDLVNKTLALSLIPTEELQESAMVDDRVNHFLLAKALLQWFKTDFFTWCDSPACPKCGKHPPKSSGLQGSPTSEEREHGASRVEIFSCDCGSEVRFPRYNSPTKLLETRTGRCGEWANCFALMAAAMDFDVRYIYDVTDHVWCELWIPELDRWVHCDPCENVIDAPLLYEKGWNKKLSYILAFGRDHVYDVTWRYSEKHISLKKRRARVREPVLSNFIEKLSKRVAASYGVDEDRGKELRRRRMKELIEFMVFGKPVDTKTYGGRTTGSTEWRSARGELGLSPKKKASIVIRPNDEELAAKKLRIAYNSPKDVYTRGNTRSKSWSSLVFKSKDVQRKVEADWKMAYLCRREDKDEGEVSWAVDLTGVKAKRAMVKFVGTSTFEDNASIVITICADDICMRVPSSGEIAVDDPPSALLKITVSFSGGRGDNAFQQAQLFRASLDTIEEQFTIEIDFA